MTHPPFPRRVTQAPFAAKGGTLPPFARAPLKPTSTHAPFAAAGLSQTSMILMQNRLQQLEALCAQLEGRLYELEHPKSESIPLHASSPLPKRASLSALAYHSQELQERLAHLETRLSELEKRLHF